MIGKLIRLCVDILNGCLILGYVVVAAKIPRRLKELMDALGIKPGPVIRRALEEEVRRRLLQELEKEIAEIKDKLQGISDEEIAELIRQDRDER